MPLLCLLFPPFQLLVAYIPDVSGEQDSGRCIGSCFPAWCSWSCCSHLSDLCYSEVEKISLILPSWCCLGWARSCCVLEHSIRLHRIYSMGGAGNHSFVLCVWYCATFPGTRFAPVLPASHWCLVVCSSVLGEQSTPCPFLLKPYVLQRHFLPPSYHSEQERPSRTCNSSCWFPFPAHWNHWQNTTSILYCHPAELRCRTRPCSCTAVTAAQHLGEAQSKVSPRSCAGPTELCPCLWLCPAVSWLPSHLLLSQQLQQWAQLCFTAWEWLRREWMEECCLVD